MANYIKQVLTGTAISLTQLNPDSSQGNNQFVCKGQKIIKCEISYSLPKRLHILSIRLKLSKISGTKTSFVLCEVIGNISSSVISNKEVGISDINDDEYQYIDLTSFLGNNTNSNVCFGIKAADEFSEFTCSNEAVIEIEAIKDEFKIHYVSPIIKEVGYFNNCIIEPNFRTFINKTNLINLNGGDLPLNLNLIYNQYIEVDRVAKHFMFNYDQFIIQDGTNYKYIDGNANVHIFMHSSGSKYYDIKEPGLILDVLSTQYIITDECHQKMYFNQDGRLTKISIKKSDTVFVENNIEYYDNKISRVTDSIGRSCSFTYYPETETSLEMIVIKKSGLNDIVLTIDNNRLISIAGIINNSSPNKQIYFEYEIIDNNTLLKTIKDPSDDVIYFTYLPNGILYDIKQYVNTVDNLLSRNVYKIDQYSSIIENYNENNSLANKNIINYDKEGNIISTYEDVDGHQIATFINNSTFYTKNYSTIKQEIFDYKFFESHDEENILFSSSSYSSNFSLRCSTISDKTYQKYNIEFDIELIEKIPLVSNTIDKLVLELIMIENDNETTLYSFTIKEELNIKQHFNRTIFIPKKEDIILLCKIRNCTFTYKARISTVKLYKYFKFGSYDCINQDTTGNTHTANSGTWWELQSPLYIEYNDNDNEVFNNREYFIEMTKLDYLLTLNSYYHNRTSTNRHSLWYNNGRNCVTNAKNVLISLSPGCTFSPYNVTLGVVDESLYDTKVQILEYGPYGYSIHEENTDYAGTNDYFITNSYDSYGRLINSFDSKNKKLENTYNTTQNIDTAISTLSCIGSNSIQQKIINIESITVGNDNILNSYSNVPYPTTESEEQISYSEIIDKDRGYFSKEILENNQEIIYSYKEDGKSPDSLYTSINNDQNKNTYLYSSNKISGLKHDNTTFEFEYDSRNNISNINVGGSVLVSYSYEYHPSYTLITSTYNTGYSETKKYDIHGRLINILSNNTTVYDAKYSEHNTQDVIDNELSSSKFKNALLREFFDGDITTKCFYDSTDYNDLDQAETTVDVKDNPFKQVTKISNQKYYKTFGYDSKRRVQTVYTNTNNFNHKLRFSYIDGDSLNNDLVNNIRIDFLSNTITKNIEYDNLNRVINITQANGENSIRTNLSYFTGTNYTSNNVNFIAYYINNYIYGSESIEYDSLGNISEIRYNDNKKIKYVYDGLGRLIKETNDWLEKIFIYTYDKNGNILKKQEFLYNDTDTSEAPLIETIFSYDEAYQDKLISVSENYNTYSITYGTNNSTLLPHSYKGQEFIWGGKNQLFGYKKSATSNTINYSYNSLGLRTKSIQEIQNNVEEKHEYIYDDSKIIEEIRTTYIVDSSIPTQVNPEVLGINKINYIYDESNIIGFKYNNNIYYYLRDCLGNIKYILDYSYNVICKYEYDAWGNHKVYEKTNTSFTENNSLDFIGNINPIRYKGYYYDTESGLYYCLSRYYSPLLCRWISPDSAQYLNPDVINGLNLYSYCLNNPVNYYDLSGNSPSLILFIIGIIIGAIVGFGIATYIDYKEDKSVFDGSVAWYDYLGATLLGAVVGGVIGYFAPQIGSAISSIASKSFTFGAGSYLTASGELVMSSGVTITGTQILSAAGVLGAIYMFSKHNPRMTNTPPFSWTTNQEGIEAMTKFGNDANKAADYIMNNHFENWKYGPGQPRNVIKKWLDRVIRKMLGM